MRPTDNPRQKDVAKTSEEERSRRADAGVAPEQSDQAPETPEKPDKAPAQPPKKIMK